MTTHEEYKIFKKKRLCPYCGKPKSKNYYTCKRCRKRIRTWNNNKYKELKNKGICVYCRKTKARKNRVTCQKCMILIMQGVKNRKLRFRKEKRCIECGAKRKKGRKYCPKCLKEFVVRFRRYRHRISKLYNRSYETIREARKASMLIQEYIENKQVKKKDPSTIFNHQSMNRIFTEEI